MLIFVKDSHFKKVQYHMETAIKTQIKTASSQIRDFVGRYLLWKYQLLHNLLADNVDSSQIAKLGSCLHGSTGMIL